MTRLVAVLSAFLLLAGCAGPDLAKRTFPRSTIPAAVGNATATTGAPTTAKAPVGQPVDPVFAADRLRLVDPCAVLAEELLDELGEPGVESRTGFSRCSNFMKDGSGKDLAVTVEIGQTMTVELADADKQLAGLRSHEQTLDNSACFVSVITQEQPGLGISVQIGYKDGDACAPGRKVAESVVNQVKARKGVITPAKGSLITLDPCALPDAAAVEAAVGREPDVFPYGLHNCSWAGKDRELTLDLRRTFVPDDRKFDDAQTEVDLGGGVKGYQVSARTSFPSCEVTWVQRTEADDEGEVVRVKSAGPEEVEFDRCAAAVGFAKALVGKIPRA
ncbi:DUF3558 domain-containing protein [Saccharothrix syringae]|uniref:DUF3558 domain-containing protein n=1 Tax=Saccharothrix syringae TaxID=103733 RepID=A0A5Q0HAH1_SACSY|nr:hypothetical protein [Saccharothrix syringae]QFZ22954.1 hypothetical protein EKG83_40915 [Saccharothrix syringae]